MREIRIDAHTLERAKERGTDAEHIRDVVQTGIPVIAGKGRLAVGYDGESEREARVRALTKLAKLPFRTR